MVGHPIAWGGLARPYSLAVSHLVSWCAKHLDEIKQVTGSAGPIEFFFDNRMERKPLREAWCENVETLPPEDRARFGTELHFVDDKKFMGLQAADYLVGWARVWSERGAEPELGDTYFEGARFEGLNVQGAKKPHIVIKPTVESITEFLARSLEAIEIEE